jgi:hypothetical protein
MRLEAGKREIAAVIDAVVVGAIESNKTRINNEREVKTETHELHEHTLGFCSEGQGEALTDVMVMPTYQPYECMSNRIGGRGVCLTCWAAASMSGPPLGMCSARAT